MTYDHNHRAFVVGGHGLIITPRKCDLIFGITLGDKDETIIELEDRHNRNINLLIAELRFCTSLRSAMSNNISSRK